MLANEHLAHSAMIFTIYAENTKSISYLVCQHPV